MLENARTLARQVQREIQVYRSVLKDSRTPASARWLLAMAIGYLLLPFDLIPDFIPVIGHLDDLVIVPLLVRAALRRIPHELVEEHRARMARIIPGCSCQVTVLSETRHDHPPI